MNVTSAFMGIRSLFHRKAGRKEKVIERVR